MDFAPPLCTVALSALVTAATLAFTPPSSALRPLAGILVIALTYAFHVSVVAALDNRLWKAIITTTFWFQCLHAFKNLCLIRISYDDQRRELRSLGNDNAYSRFRWALSMTWNLRGIKTPWQVKTIPTSPPVPISRGQFLYQHLKTVIITVILLDIFSSLPPPDTAVLFSEAKQHLISRLPQTTAADLVVRALAVLAFYINTVCLISLMYSTLATIFVGLGLGQPDSWPDNFGPLSQAYTVRQFWGTTWHQTLRWGLTSYADYAIHSILHLPKGGLLSRYSKILFCFLLSGILHFSADVASATPPAQSGSVKFFTITALAIIVEDGVQFLTLRAFGGKRDSPWRRRLGYLWVVLFLFWLTPAWVYPSIRSSRPEKDVMLPFSMIGWLKKHV